MPISARRFPDPRPLGPLGRFAACGLLLAAAAAAAPAQTFAPGPGYAEPFPGPAIGGPLVPGGGYGARRLSGVPSYRPFGMPMLSEIGGFLGGRDGGADGRRAARPGGERVRPRSVPGGSARASRRCRPRRAPRCPTVRPPAPRSCLAPRCGTVCGPSPCDPCGPIGSYAAPLSLAPFSPLGCAAPPPLCAAPPPLCAAPPACAAPVCPPPICAAPACPPPICAAPICPPPVCETELVPVPTTKYARRECVTWKEVECVAYRNRKECYLEPVVRKECRTVDRGCYKMVWCPKLVSEEICKTDYVRRVRCVKEPYTFTKRVAERSSRMVPYCGTTLVPRPVRRPVCPPPCPPACVAPAPGCAVPGGYGATTDAGIDYGAALPAAPAVPDAGLAQPFDGSYPSAPPSSTPAPFTGGEPYGGTYQPGDVYDGEFYDGGDDLLPVPDGIGGPSSPGAPRDDFRERRPRRRRPRREEIRRLDAGAGSRALSLRVGAATVRERPVPCG